MIDPATCPPARVRVPLYMGANTLPDGRICIWDELGSVTVDGSRRGRAERVRQAITELETIRAERFNRLARERR